MSQKWKSSNIVVRLIVLFIVTFSLRSSIIDRLPIGYFVTSKTSDVVPASSDLVNLGFSHFAVVQAREREIRSEHDYQLTGVVLHWKRLQGVQHAVQRLLDSRLFKELIVWNNNPEINLTADALVPNNYSSNLIRVINSKENIKDEAKYRACSEAKTPACYYADDDWDTSDYIGSLVASFRSDPTRLHSVTDPGTYYTNLMWSYFDSHIDLHTGFSWIGCGSVFLREHAQRHLQLLHHHLGKEPGTTNKKSDRRCRASILSLQISYVSATCSSLCGSMISLLNWTHTFVRFLVPTVALHSHRQPLFLTSSTEARFWRFESWRKRYGRINRTAVCPFVASKIVFSHPMWNHQVHRTVSSSTAMFFH